MEEVDAFLEANYLLPISSGLPAARCAVSVGAYGRLTLRTTNLLRQANINTTEDLQAKRIEELLEVPRMDADALNEIVTRCPPIVRDEQELLLLLTSSSLVRTRLEKMAAPTIDNILDTFARCQDKVVRQIKLGVLHERALMDWDALQSINRQLRPPARALPDLLVRLQLLPIGSHVEAVGKLDEALETATIDEEITLLFGLLDNRAAEIARERFSLGEHPTLEELGQRFAVSRERVRQIQNQAAEEISSAYYCGLPLPRIRTAMLLIRQSQAVAPDEIYDLLNQRGLTTSKSAVRDLLTAWRVIDFSESSINESLAKWKVVDAADFAFPEDILLFAKTGLTSRHKALSEDVIRLARPLVRQVGVVTPAHITNGLARHEAASKDDVITVLLHAGFRQIVPEHWSGGAREYNVPRTVVDKMLSVCGALSLRHLRRGLLRHQRRQGYPVAPVAVLRAVLKQYEEFDIGQDDIVRLKDTNVRPKLGKWERVWLDLVDHKGPVVHTDSIHRAFADNNLRPITAYVLTRKSSLVESVGKQLFCLPGAQFTDADITRAREQALVIEPNPILTFDETGTAVVKTTVQQYMDRNGSVSAGPAEVLKGRWKTVVAGKEIGEFTVGKPWIYGLNEARAALSIRAGDRIQIRFDTWTQNAHVSVIGRGHSR